MKFFFYLTKNHPGLPAAEAKALIKAFDGKVIKEFDNVLIAEAKGLKPERLALTHFSCELIDEAESVSNLDLAKLSSFPFNSFSVEAVKLTEKPVQSTQIIKKRVGSRIKGKVDLERPEIVFRAFVSHDKIFLTRQISKYSSVEERRVNSRPFSHPASCQPRQARTLVNLSGIKSGGKLLDPFCGSGGILLEAASMGVECTGLDLDGKSVEGARENVEFFDLGESVSVEQADFFEWSGGEFDAVVSELPFGKSSKLFGRTKKEVFDVEKVLDHLKPGCKAVLVAPEELEVPGLQQFFEQRIHKSLSKFVHVIEKD